MGSDLSAAHWLLRYSVRLREREHEATELRTFSVRPVASAAAPLLLPPGPAAPPRRRHRRAVANVPLVDVDVTDVDVPVFVESFAPPAVDDPTDVDAVRVIFESARAPSVTTDVDVVYRTPSFLVQSVTDRMPNVAEAEWTPVRPDVTATSPRPVFVVSRELSPSPFVSVHISDVNEDEVDVVTPTSLSDLRGSVVSRPPRVTMGLLLTPPPMPEMLRLAPPPVVLDPPTPPPACAPPPSVMDAAPPPPPPPERRILALPAAELPNPWAPDRAAFAAVADAPAEDPPKAEGGSVRAALLRGVIMLALSAVVGVGIQTGVKWVKRMRHAPVTASVAVSPLAPPPAPALLPPLEGDLEIHAPPAAAITVDGKARGTGPSLTLKIAPGYHTVRVGLEKTAIVEVHRGTLAAVDLSK